MRSFNHQLPGLDVGIPFFLPGWMVMLSAPCYFGGPKVPAQTQKAAPPPAPPAPPRASDATAATRTLIRDIASQRSRQTTVLTRRRDKLTPGSTDWPVNNSGTALTQPPPPPASSLSTPLPVDPTSTQTLAAPTPGSGIGSIATPGSGIGGSGLATPGSYLDSLFTAVNYTNTLSPTYGDSGFHTITEYPLRIAPGYDDQTPFNQVTEYLM